MAELPKPIDAAEIAAAINSAIQLSDGDVARAYAIAVTATSVMGHELGKPERQRMYDHMSVQEHVNGLNLFLGLDNGNKES